MQKEAKGRCAVGWGLEPFERYSYVSINVIIIIIESFSFHF